MSNPKSHFYFRNPIEGTTTYTPKPRGGRKEDEEEEKDYRYMRNEFKNCLDNFEIKRKERQEKRNPYLQVPAHIEYIEIEFFNSFDKNKFEGSYLNQFGLALIRQDKFNTLVLFAIENLEKFQSFIQNIKSFIQYANRENQNILFIKQFRFYGTENIIKYQYYIGYALISLTQDFTRASYQAIKDYLFEYLESENITYKYNDDAYSIDSIEIWAKNSYYIENIVNNFDVIESITSSATTIISPSIVNLPKRDYSFSIANPSEDLPIVGIIDTGISKTTPLAQLLINEGKEFDLTNTDPCIDRANHGTSVAFLAALGAKMYPNNFNGVFEADCRLLSLKIMDTSQGFPSQAAIKDLIQEAHNKYGVKIYTLTISSNQNKVYNTLISEYAYTLDMLAYELDILICIAVGNNGNLLSHFGLVQYPYYFKDQDRTLNVPADSMNNLSIGAISDNFEQNGKDCFTEYSNFPASYTLKNYINWEDEELRDRKVINIFKKNGHLVKPDIVYCGGDFDVQTEIEKTGLTVLSAHFNEFWKKEVGTSFSTPLIANIAAKLLKKYPNLRYNMQTLKALIINSTYTPNYGDCFTKANIPVESLIGKGIPNENICLSSEDDCVTLVLEDSVKAEKIKVYRFSLPPYLANQTTKQSILEITATLCFKFKPVYFNFLSYCPIHIAFGFFKGTDNIETLKNAKVEDIKIKAGISWSEDYYPNAKLLSNCQKKSFKLTKNDLVNNNNQFKIAVHSKYHKLLNDAEKNIEIDHPFSLVIRVEDISKEKSAKLYEEIRTVNNLDIMAEVEAILEI